MAACGVQVGAGKRTAYACSRLDLGRCSKPRRYGTAGALVFALSTGEPTLEVKANGKPYTLAEIEKASTHATLYVLDGETGKQLYSSENQVGASSFGSGLAIANGRIYFGASDNSIYSFGFSKMQPQLTDR